MSLSKGCVQIYTGNGKGKTTSSFGLALRALGWDYKVAIIHFMKFDLEKGERKLIKLFPNLFIESVGTGKFVDKKKPDAADIEGAKAGLKLAYKLIENDNFDIMILDEINTAIDFGLLDIADVIKFIKTKP
ncbi:MAG: cob(I)yrinic acid a,c-diamide adenosyltransferase, partial [Pseudomonadota bacterium]